MNYIKIYKYNPEKEYYIFEADPGKYCLECWGANGGNAKSEHFNLETFQMEEINNRGGIGGYSRCTFICTEKTKLYLKLGQCGSYCTEQLVDEDTGEDFRYGGAGGGKAVSSGYNFNAASGGDCTTISTKLIDDYLSNDIIIIAGGGGGACGNLGQCGGDALSWRDGTQTDKSWDEELEDTIVNAPQSSEYGWVGGAGLPFGKCFGEHQSGTGGFNYVNLKQPIIEVFTASFGEYGFLENPDKNKNGCVRITY